MGKKTKVVEKKTTIKIETNYKPIPKFQSGCKNC
jgi:hypothetical protein